MVNFYSQINRQNGDEKKVPDSVLANNKTAKSDYKKFTDSPDGFGASEFNWAIWYVKNKLLLYRLGVGSLIVICSLTIGFSLWRAFNILYFDLTAGSIMDRQLTMSVDYSTLRAKFSPAPLEILNSYSLINGKNKVDVLAEVQNPNERHLVYFDYYFDFGANQTEKKTDFLLPGELRPIVIFGLDIFEFAGAPSVVIENIRWQRISAHEITEVIPWQEERINFSISDFTFSYAGEEGVLSHALRFEVFNNSAYGYRNPLFYLGLFQNQNLVGIMRFDLVDFASLEKRQVDLRNYADNLSVNEIRLYPVIDLYNKSVYLLPRR
jgi:hypothetical protein